MRWRGLSDPLALFDFRARRAEFYRDFAEMYRRNEAMVSFLEGEISNAHATRHASRARALRLMLQRHQSGENASQVSTLLEGVAPRSDAMMLLAVDRAADKPAALLALADSIDKRQEMLRTMRTHCALPALILPICYALIALLGQVILVIDQTVPVYAQDELWSGVNGWARGLAAFFAQWGGLSFCGVSSGIALLLWSLPRWRGSVRLRAEGWPVYSLYRDFQAGMLFCTMAMLLRTGGTLRGSIEDVAQRASPWMRWHLGRVLDALEESPAATLDAFRRGLLGPHLLARAVTLNRSSAAFSDVLIALGTTEGERVLARVRTAALAANLALVGAFAGIATFMGVASVTVPGKFASLMEPSSLMTLRARYEAAHPLP